MSGERGMPHCVRCGYALVGNPPPRRCPECGHQPRLHERWIEGELHREGPSVVLPVLVRQVAACVALLGPIALGALLNPDTLKALEIPFTMDGRWCQAAAGVGAVIAAFLWTRPLRTRDAHQFALGISNAWRGWLPLMQLCWVPYAALLVVAVLMPPSAAGSAPADERLMRWAAIVAIVAQVPWILLMRHVANLADYLRDGRVRKSVNAWTWVWVVATVALMVRAPFQARYGNGVDLDEMLQLMRALSRLGLVWGGLNGLVVLWLCAHSLALAHEEVARDDRRAQREDSRYRVPD